MPAIKVLIFHGTQGSPNANWFPWLQKYLMMLGCQVAVPTLPTPEEQSLGNWLQALEDQVPSYQEADVIIGHSCGGAFALRILEKRLICPAQAILVGTVINTLGNQFDKSNKSFVDAPFDWPLIKDSCNNITVFHGDNDPYVSMSHAETISTGLNAPLHIIKDGGHINSEAGYTEFPEILDVINA